MPFVPRPLSNNNVHFLGVAHEPNSKYDGSLLHSVDLNGDGKKSPGDGDYFIMSHGIDERGDLILSQEKSHPALGSLIGSNHIPEETNYADLSSIAQALSRAKREALSPDISIHNIQDNMNLIESIFSQPSVNPAFFSTINIHQQRIWMLARQTIVDKMLMAVRAGDVDLFLRLDTDKDICTEQFDAAFIPFIPLRVFSEHMIHALPKLIERIRSYDSGTSYGDFNREAYRVLVCYYILRFKFYGLGSFPYVEILGHLKKLYHDTAMTIIDNIKREEPLSPWKTLGFYQDYCEFNRTLSNDINSAERRTFGHE